VSSAAQAESQQRQSAAAPSPFTPIAEYAAARIIFSERVSEIS